MKDRRLNEEESQLWRKVTKDVAPIARPKVSSPIVEDGRAANTEPAIARQISKASQMHSRSGQTSSGPTAKKTPSGSHKSSAPIASKSVAKTVGRRTNARPAQHGVFGAGDPGLDKRVARRRLSIDRVLDLHGLTQVHARTRLETFLHDAYADGCRCVLVITGKGGAASAANMARARKARRYDGAADSHHHLQRASGGVLRERVPQWIDASALHSAVSRVSRARPKDGGDGAYYVFLKARS